MKLSCTDNMVPGSTITEKARNLKSWGYEGIAVFANYNEWNEEQYEELLGLHEKTGIQPCEFVFVGPDYGHLMDKDNAQSRRTIELYKSSIEVCKKLGAITEFEYEYKSQDPLPLFDPYLKMPPESKNRFINLAEELSSAAENSKAYILLEPCNRYETRYLTRLEDCKEIIKTVQGANIGLLADFFHMSIEESNISESILDCGSMIKHVHLGDSNRLMPGYGHIDWPAGFRALKEIGFKGYMNLECGMVGNPQTVLPEIAVYIKRIIDSFN